MKRPGRSRPRCIVIAGPNGAGKTTFARDILVREAGVVYLKIGSAALALRRIAARVKQGGHNIPRDDVLRRFGRSWRNFESAYRPLADKWSVYDNSGVTPVLLERGP